MEVCIAAGRLTPWHPSLFLAAVAPKKGRHKKRGTKREASQERMCSVVQPPYEAAPRAAAALGQVLESSTERVSFPVLNSGCISYPGPMKEISS